MINITVGPAGDQTTMMAALASLGVTLTDDVTITQEGVTTETATSNITIALAGYSLVITSDTPHNGDPLVGHISTVTGANGLYVGLILTGTGSCEIMNLNAVGDVGAFTTLRAINVQTAGPDVSCHDCIVDLSPVSGISSYAYQLESSSGASGSTDINIWNCVAKGGVNGGGGSFYLLNGYPGVVTIENCSAQGGGQNYNFSGHAIIATNCVAIGGTVDFIGHGGATGTNNASEDATVADGNWSSGTGNIGSITPGNEFLSTSMLSTNYFKVITGGSLADGGVAVAIAANTTGIRGTVRPHNTTLYSIGADEYLAISAPTITLITPDNGREIGISPVTIDGTNFVDTPTVTFDGVPATFIVLVGPTQITCEAPAGTPGAIDVVVTNPDTGTVTEVGGYTYNATPTITLITPDNGVQAGSTAVTIDGTGFIDAPTVEFDGVPATSVVFVGPTQITCVSPAGIGVVDVVVTNPDSGRASAAGGYAYISIPTITLITPDTGVQAGGTAVTIDGTEFLTAPTVTFDGTPATNIVFVGVTQITCDAPAGIGVVDVVVTNTDTGTVTAAGGYAYISIPTITLITPNDGPDTGGTAVTIDGTEFLTAPTVTFDGVPATSIVFVGVTQITCVSPAGTAGAIDVVVTNTDTGTVTSAGGYTYISTPTITLITPARGLRAGGTAVTIDGTDFVATPTVTFDGVPATSVVFVGATQLTCVSPAGVGIVDVVVTNPDTGATTSAGGYTYIIPTVTSVTPNDGLRAGGTAVTIAGADFAATPTVTFGGVAATSVVFASSISLTCVTPAGTGVVDVIVTNPDAGVGTLAGGYSYGTVQTDLTVSSRLGDGMAGIFRSSPDIGDLLNQIAINLLYIQTASQNDNFAEFKSAMEDVTMLSGSGATVIDQVTIPNRMGEGHAGMTRAGSSNKFGSREVLDQIAANLDAMKTASQLTDFAAFKVAMAAISLLLKSNDSRI